MLTRGPKTSFLVIPLLVLLIGGSVWAEPQLNEINWGQGPIEVQNPYPLPLLHLHVTPTTSEVLALNHSKLRASMDWSNTFVLKEGRYIFDGESRAFNVSVAHSFVENLESTLDLPFIWRGNGALDSVIDNFHKTFGLPRGKRPAVSDNRFIYAGVTESDSAFVLSDRGARIGGYGIGNKYLLTKGDESMPAVSLLSKILLPAPDTTYGQDRLDILSEVIASKRFGSFVLYGGAGYIYYWDDDIAELPFARNHLEGFINLEYEVNTDVALEVAFYGASRDISDVVNHPSYATYIDTGIKYRLNPNSTLEFSIRENPSPQDGTSDVAFLFAVAVEM